MKKPCVLLLAALLPACATLGAGSGGERGRLWDEAHAAFARDSLVQATERFGRLAAEYPETKEGREARFFLGALRLDPRNTRFSAATAAQDLRAYLAQDSARERTIYRRHEAETLLELAGQLERPCEERTAALRCTPEVVTQRVPGPTQTVPNPNGASAAQVERLRAELAERDAEIRRLREELNRIRETLVPRRP